MSNVISFPTNKRHREIEYQEFKDTVEANVTAMENVVFKDMEVMLQTAPRKIAWTIKLTKWYLMGVIKMYPDVLPALTFELQENTCQMKVVIGEHHVPFLTLSADDRDETPQDIQWAVDPASCLEEALKDITLCRTILNPIGFDIGMLTRHDVHFIHQKTDGSHTTQSWVSDDCLIKLRINVSMIEQLEKVMASDFDNNEVKRLVSELLAAEMDTGV